MELVVLGSGTGIPHPYRNPAGYLVRADGLTILVDSGAGTIHRLPRIGVDFLRVREVFYTHLHPDHILDLISLLFAKRIPGATNAPTLTIRGGPGLAELMEKLQAAFHPWLEPRDYQLRVEEYRSPVTCGGLRVSARSINHHPSSLAYRFEDGDGRSLVFSGDTGEDEALIEQARHATLLVLECAFPEGQGVAGHLTPSLAGKIAQKASVQRLLLTHFYPACDGREILGPCKDAFGGEVLLAHDWMHVTVD